MVLYSKKEVFCVIFFLYLYIWQKEYKGIYPYSFNVSHMISYSRYIYLITHSFLRLSLQEEPYFSTIFNLLSTAAHLQS